MSFSTILISESAMAETVAGPVGWAVWLCTTALIVNDRIDTRNRILKCFIF
jgi:hypothetical protein